MIVGLFRVLKVPRTDGLTFGKFTLILWYWANLSYCIKAISLAPSATQSVQKINSHNKSI